MPIERREIAPKTFELYNTEQMAPPDLPSEQQVAQPDVQAQMFEEMQQKAGFAPASKPQEQQRRAWRKQLQLFDKTLKHNDDPQQLINDQIQGAQELLDSGAVWIDENGDVYGALEHHPGGEKGTRRMLDAFRTWGDWRRDQAENQPELTDAELLNRLKAVPEP
jgi:hypothetical protein